MSNEIEPRTPAEQVVLLATPPDARDVTAELAAPPRRRLPWLSLALAGGVIATAAFAGGVWYQQDNGSGSGKTVAAGGGQQPRAGATGGANGTRRGAGQGQTGQGQGQSGQGQGGQGGGGFARGTVKAVDGTTVYLTDANGNTVKVTTGDATKVQLNKEGKVADLQPGQSVTVVGTPAEGGGYNATQLIEGAATGGFGGGFGGGGFGGARTPSGG
ncbi:hypothetical protein ACIGZJ_23790 [Kitasatospora sp. NPDC052868]|uniref:hypothetical protein n=1 Tax=Kitasatospora sp. NPDC052868 TaxID=3364060 RepID=UPI0037CAE9E2